MAKPALLWTRRAIVGGLVWGVGAATLWWGKEYGWSVTALKSPAVALGIIIWLAGGQLFGVVFEWSFGILSKRFLRRS
jgi:hypothetical protein